MAHHKQALKRIRRTVRRAAVNTDRRSRVRSFLRKVEEAIAGGDRKQAEAAFHTAQPELMGAARRGVFHRNTASRKISRLASRIKSMA